MSKIHPVENQKTSRRRHQPLTKPIFYPHPSTISRHGSHEYGSDSPSVLTVWKRSSMSFQGSDGFTVFDHRGRLVFRVDNYTRKSWSISAGGGAGLLLLMDGSGRPLLTLKPQLFSIQHQWTAYRGEDHHEGSSRAFTMRRPVNNMIIPKTINACEAEVFIGDKNTTTTADTFRTRTRTPKPDLKAQGSFRMRNCQITATAGGQLVATISRKRINSTLLLSDDVFTLTVQPGFQPDLVMAIVIILDRICYKSFTPILCS